MSRRPTTAAEAEEKKVLAQIRDAVVEAINVASVDYRLFDPMSSYSAGWPSPDARSLTNPWRNFPSLPSAMGPVAERHAREPADQDDDVALYADIRKIHTGTGLSMRTEELIFFASQPRGPRKKCISSLKVFIASLPKNNEFRRPLIELMNAVDADSDDVVSARSRAITEIAKALLDKVALSMADLELGVIEVKPEVKKKRDQAWLPIAITLVQDNPYQSDAQIAKAVEIDKSVLSRKAEYRKAAQESRLPRDRYAKGYSTDDGIEDQDDDDYERTG